MSRVENNFINWPFGAAEEISPDYAAAIAVTIKNSKTIIHMPALTGAPTLNLTLQSELKTGAELTIVVAQGATGRNVTFGTGFVTADALVGVANDTDVVQAIYSEVEDAFIITAKTKIVDAA